MISKLKGMFNTEDKKRLLSNFISLSSLQAVNYILPLITFPYLIRVLGIEKFGLLAFATAVIAYFNIITDYGFNLTATRAIAINRNRPSRLNQIISSVIIIKLTLMMLSFCLLCLLVFSFDKFRDEALIYLLTFGTVIGQVLFPVWFFQGMERMKYITYLNIVSKVIFTLAIFIFVNQESDYYLVPVFTSVGYIIAGLLSLSFIITRFHIKFSFQKIIILKHYLKDGWHVFCQQFYVSLYGPINILILGLFTNNVIVGSYSIAERIVSIPVSLFNMFTQAYYPYSVNIFKKSKKKYFDKLKIVLRSFCIVTLLILIVYYFANDFIINLIVGNENIEVLTILNILILGIVFSVFGSFYTQAFLILNKAKILNKISFYIMIMNFICVPVFIYFYQTEGLAIIVVIRQFLVILVCTLWIKQFKKDVLKC